MKNKFNIKVKNEKVLKEELKESSKILNILIENNLFKKILLLVIYNKKLNVLTCLPIIFEIILITNITFYLFAIILLISTLILLIAYNIVTFQILKQENNIEDLALDIENIKEELNKFKKIDRYLNNQKDQNIVLDKIIDEALKEKEIEEENEDELKYYEKIIHSIENPILSRKKKGMK